MPKIPRISRHQYVLIAKPVPPFYSIKEKLWQSAPSWVSFESVVCNQQWEKLMQHLGLLWIDYQGAVEIILWFFAFTLMCFLLRGTRLNRKAMKEKFWRDFTNQKVISLLQWCVMICLKALSWRHARKNQKLSQTVEVPVCNQHKRFQCKGCKLSSQQEENPPCNR